MINSLNREWNLQSEREVGREEGREVGRERGRKTTVFAGGCEVAGISCFASWIRARGSDRREG